MHQQRIPQRPSQEGRTHIPEVEMEKNPMQKKLRIIVLKHLAEKPRAGYGLIKDIEECTGWKPSYGSIYPLLENLKTEGLIEVEEEGKKKIYHLTKDGKAEVKKLEKLQSSMIEQMQEKMKLMAHMIGFDSKKHDEIMDLFFGAIKRGEMPFKEVMASTTRMKMVFWDLYKAGKVKKNTKKINAIMDEATAKLHALLEESK
jgi:DNA-binding PadR family transcriptional regulator